MTQNNEKAPEQGGEKRLEATGKKKYFVMPVNKKSHEQQLGDLRSEIANLKEQLKNIERLLTSRQTPTP